MNDTKTYIESNKDRFINELFELLRIPSVSADPKYKNDVMLCAQKVKQKLSDAGLDNVELISTAGHPVVYGDKVIDKNLPTVLVYGHYDVQPPDPIDLWETGPFDPVIRNGKINARGSADDKGQVYMHVKAVEYMISTGQLPCNVKFMIEGEEEVGSANLGTFLHNNLKKLSCDVVLLSDTSMISNEIPS